MGRGVLFFLFDAIVKPTFAAYLSVYLKVYDHTRLTWSFLGQAGECSYQWLAPLIGSLINMLSVFLQTFTQQASDSIYTLSFSIFSLGYHHDLLVSGIFVKTALDTLRLIKLMLLLTRIPSLNNGDRHSFSCFLSTTRLPLDAASIHRINGLNHSW